MLNDGILLSIIKFSYSNNVIKSIIFVIILVILRAIILRTLSMNKKLSMDTLRRWAVNSRNLVLLLSLIGMATIWAQQLSNFALSMVAFVVALVVATKELIMCLGGAFMRTITNSYTLGDHVEIGAYRGRVIDIDMLSTTIMELGPSHLSHQFTGRAISIPNSLLLSQPVIRENYMGNYVAHVITIPVSNNISMNKSEIFLMSAAQELCAPFIENARRHMFNLEKQRLVDTPAVEPRIAIRPIDKDHYMIILRITIPASERHHLEQIILRRFMQETYDVDYKETSDLLYENLNDINQHN